jgi:hypothetical protein
MPKKINIAIALAALVLIVAASIFAYYKISKGPDVPNDVNNNQNSSGNPAGSKVDSAIGQLPSGFPEVLAPVGGTLDTSYTIQYDKANQYTANFKSNRTVSAEYNSYLSYLTTNKYTILNKELKSDFAHIYAQNSEVNINITIEQSKTSKTLNIVVSYLKSK